MQPETAHFGRADWRISLDRAWRSEPLRRQFEAECRISPLSDTETGQQDQAISGHMQAYHEQFLVWATRHLGLVDHAPADIRRKLSQ